MMIENTALQGTVNMVLRGPDGRVKGHKTIRNKVMNAGIAHIVGRMINPKQDGSTTPSSNDFPFMMRYMGIGTGTQANLGAPNTIKATGLASLDSTLLNQTDDKSLYEKGYDTESGGFPGTEYRLQAEITTGTKTVKPQDIADFQATGTFGTDPDTGANYTSSSLAQMRKGRIDMGFMNYGTIVTDSAHADYQRYSINFEDVSTHSSGVGAETAVQRLTSGDTTMLFQGDTLTTGTLQADTTTYSPTPTAEGTTVAEDAGTSSVISRITAFTDLYGFVGGYDDGAGATVTGWGNTTGTPSSTDYLARILAANIAWQTTAGTIGTSTGSQPTITRGVITVGSDTGSVWETTKVFPKHMAGAHATLGGTIATNASPITAATGKGSPIEKRHQRAVYTSKKLGQRLVFVALFPPQSPFKTGNGGASAGEGEVAITEAGIFNHPVAGQAKQTMLCRTVFSVVTKQPEDSLQITWSIAFTDSTPTG